MAVLKEKKKKTYWDEEYIMLWEKGIFGSVKITSGIYMNQYEWKLTIVTVLPPLVVRVTAQTLMLHTLTAWIQEGKQQ